MNIISTSIQGVYIIKATPLSDERGFFYRAFCDQELNFFLEHQTIRQINISHTKNKGGIRGLHFQYPPFSEKKLVRCLRGRVWDVALDLRQGSPTFLQWYGHELSPENATMLLIPEGCAHGFQTLESDSELLYLHTEPYLPQSEGGIRYNDPTATISWPLEVTDISAKDSSHPLLTSDFQGVAL